MQDSGRIGFSSNHRADPERRHGRGARVDDSHPVNVLVAGSRDTWFIAARSQFLAGEPADRNGPPRILRLSRNPAQRDIRPVPAVVPVHVPEPVAASGRTQGIGLSPRRSARVSRCGKRLAEVATFTSSGTGSPEAHAPASRRLAARCGLGTDHGAAGTRRVLAATGMHLPQTWPRSPRSLFADLGAGSRVECGYRTRRGFPSTRFEKNNFHWIAIITIDLLSVSRFFSGSAGLVIRITEMAQRIHRLRL
ncbi:hypothetical protein ACFORO_29235 [Amycolatopsis halotolerans]|uniref:Uncharacterized protein n=1 Tax=Amycolatopsis halotolerans TaxID=330083 RepID=A0ABV7QQP1_9PSEU